MEEMIEGSLVLEELSQSSDPHITYSIIAGNTSLYSTATLSISGKEHGRLALLMHRIFSQNISHSLAGLAFFDQPNDIAVPVESIEFVPSDRSPQPQLQEIACDHLTYFTTVEALKTLVEVFNLAL